MVTFSVLGQPIAFKARHQNEDRRIFKEKIKSMYEDKALKGMLEIELNFVIAAPKSMQGRFKAQEFLPHTKKPDLDALTKFAIKNLERVAFRDAGQLVRIVSKKVYGEVPETKITIKKISIEEFDASHNN
jgi:Holliday junction resolvase RusA-like endonuclease